MFYDQGSNGSDHPANEEDGDCLLAASGKTGARVVSRRDQDSAETISRAELRAASDAFCHDKRSPVTKQSPAANSVPPDSPKRAWCRLFGQVHENTFCPIQIECRAPKPRGRNRPGRKIHGRAATRPTCELALQKSSAVSKKRTRCGHQAPVSQRPLRFHRGGAPDSASAHRRRCRKVAHCCVKEIGPLETNAAPASFSPAPHRLFQQIGQCGCVCSSCFCL
jgi:hypothetical protein